MSSIERIMKKFLVPFSGIPIFKIENAFQINKKEYTFLKNLKFDNLTTNNKILNDKLKISKNKNILKLNKFQRIKKLIWNNFEDYVDNVLEIENVFSFCQSWCTIQKSNSYHSAHAHPNNIFSCVYYAKAKETYLQFSTYKSKLQESFFFSYNIRKPNLFNSTRYTFPLQTGDIIFFPGDLCHESLLNKDEERIIIGASFFLDGKLGSDETNNAIDITNNK